MSNVIDFDAFRAEQQEEPVELILGGRTYQLATSLPAALALDIVRMNSAGADEEVSDDYLQKVGEALLGDQFMPILTEHHITLKELPELIKMVFAAYGGGTVEVAAPNREARRRAKKSTTVRSSETGTSSRQTSPASITSISPASSPV